MDTQIRTELTEFIVKNYLFGDIARMPGDDDSFVEEGIIDSTGILELIEFLESRFGVEVSESEMVPENLGSVSKLTKFIRSKRALSLDPPRKYVSVQARRREGALWLGTMGVAEATVVGERGYLASAIVAWAGEDPYDV